MLLLLTYELLDCLIDAYIEPILSLSYGCIKMNEMYGLLLQSAFNNKG